MSELFKKIGTFQLQPSLAAAYGVILHTDRDPFVSKVIDDNTLCRALNETSGNRWILFGARAKQGRIGYPNIPPGSMGMMVLMWQEPQENQSLLEQLHLDSTEDLPCLLILFPHGNDEAFVHKVKIEGKTVEETFDSLRNSVKAITEAIEGVIPENLKNAAGVHAAVGLRLQTEKQWAMLKKSVPFLSWVKQIAG